LTPPPVVTLPVTDGRKKRKIGNRDGNNGRDLGNSYGDNGSDTKGGFDVADLGLGDGDDGDELLTMSDDHMVSSTLISYNAHRLIVRVD